MVSNKGFMIRCKAVTAIMFKVVGPPIRPNQTSIELPETPLQKYLSIR